MQKLPDCLFQTYLITGWKIVGIFWKCIHVKKQTEKIQAGSRVQVNIYLKINLHIYANPKILVYEGEIFAVKVD
jgi:hypothetical protein